LTDSNFIQFGYWDSLKKGLLSGEKLSYDLKRLEMAYLDQHRREYEITKQISLVLHDPLALIALKETGQCEVFLPEALFDADYPGHYMRRIKSLSLTIPCVVGPYTSINCTLTLLNNKTRIKTIADENYGKLDEDEGRFVTNFAAMQSIATSTAQNDSGIFELNFRDECYLPFEVAGTTSSWRIDMPTDCNAFDFDTITDVIIKLNYTAREGGQLLKASAKKALKDEIENADTSQLVRLFSLKHEFSTEWYQFLHPTDPTNSQDIKHVISLQLNQDRFPFQFRGQEVSVNSLIMFLKVEEDFSSNSDKLKIHLNNDAGDAGKDFTSDGSPFAGLPFTKPEINPIPIPTQFNLEVREADLPKSPASDTTWWQKVQINGKDHIRLNPDAIKDIWLVYNYTVQIP
jgi:hypothetical protein